jgi:hypothetical protein
LRGSGQLGPNGISGAGHKRRRHGTNNIRKATNGSSGEAQEDKNGETGDDKSAGNTTAQRKVKEDNSSGNGGTSGSSDDISNVGASSAGRDKEIGGEVGRRGF